ncbi:probable F-box protein At2g36090 [Lolium rigidum]|uniref:probable F-box protein At2g36090 n=1 Tax=Lolium rigidum TaxID=89674 RepID=UPI001F5D3511|nr:probable F-box protein At2g36090 [Lolium rigidum]
MVTTIEDVHADVLACALRRLDGRSLAAASCATAGLRALAADPDTWRALCLAQWPSLAAHPGLLSAIPPRRLFADASPFPRAQLPPTPLLLPDHLLSAVDVSHRGTPLLSRVVSTPGCSTPWFRGAPFRVDAVDCKKPAPITAPFSPAELELSWLVVDPARGRAVNVSSGRAVAVGRHWYTGETLVRFAVVLGGCCFETTVACSEEAAHVSEVSLAVEDADGSALSGEGALRLLAAAMVGERRGGEREREEVRARYHAFVRSKKGRKESRARREAIIDLCCSAASAVVVLAFIASVVLR